MRDRLAQAEDARIFAESVVDTVQTSLLVLDEELNIISANRRFYETFGVSPEETEGYPVYQLGNGQWNIPELRDLLETVIPRDEAFEEFRVEHSFERIGERVMSLSGRLIAQGGGREKLVLLSINDTTQRERAEQALRRSEQRYRLLVESINSIIVQAGPDGRIGFVNRFTSELFGISHDELIGKPLFGTLIPCDGPEACESLRRRALEEAEPYYIEESEITTSDGKPIFFSWSAKAVRDEAGKMIELLIDGNDMTPLRAYRRHLENAMHLLDNSPDAVAFIKSDGEVVLYNHPLASLTGQRADPNRPLRIETLGSTSESGAALHNLFRRARASGRTERQELTADQLRFEYLAVPDREAGGEVTGVMLFGRDITDLKQAQGDLEAALRRAEHIGEELKERNAELDAFSHSVSHDLRGPLRAMTGFSNALREDYGPGLDETAHDYLQRIDQAAQAMNDIVDGLLSLSRIVRMEPVIQRVDLSELARAVVQELRDVGPPREVTVEIQDGIVAEGDPRIIRTVLSNLLGNAWKFTARTGQARIAFCQVERAQGMTYCVSDNGIGFQPGQAGEIFHPFKRLHSEKTFPGSGIGLATTARAIRRHRGRIWAEGEPGRGATFCFTLGKPG